MTTHHIRREQSGDREAVGRILVEAFGDEGPQIVELVDALRSHRCGRDAFSFVAMDGESVVGHTLVTRSRLDTFPATIEVAVLSPLAVAPANQRRGVARALLDRAVQEAADAGFPVIFLEGDPAFYSRLGWLAAKPLGFRKPSIRIPDAAFQCRLLPSYQEWMTGTLVYAEPFWDLDCVGLRDPEFLTWLAVEVAQGRQL